MDVETEQPTKPMFLAATKAGEAVSTPGRRKYFNYFDLGVTAATDGFMRAVRTTSKQGLGQATGWHYHDCQVQFVYQLTGWVDLAFEDGTVFHMEAGDSALIPGGCRHNELDASEEFEALEISVPAEMGTIGCDPPEGMS